jgi:hypothetical protein
MAKNMWRSLLEVLSTPSGCRERVGTQSSRTASRVFLQEHNVMTEWDGQFCHDRQVYEKKWRQWVRGKPEPHTIGGIVSRPRKKRGKRGRTVSRHKGKLKG